MTYTTTDAFFEALWDAGITHCFVNLGSDHPSFLEAMVKGLRNGTDFPRIITCPNEMVAMSMADGYAKVTGKPQAVIVHVDVGTQALGAALHNASCGRTPVLIFAGLSPITCEGELKGSRTEFIHWLQDIPDQKAIVAQYCRYTAEIRTGVNVKQVVNRALQFATSDPAGPVYLMGAREVMESEIKPYSIRQDLWNPVELGGLSSKAASRIAMAIATAEKPLIITGYSGRNHKVPPALVNMADTVKALRVLDAAGSDMCFPAEHPAWLGVKIGRDDSIKEADVILVLACDVPWIPTHCKPRDDARVFHVDLDPLKQTMPLFYIQAQERYKADALTSIEQILADLESGEAAAKLQARDQSTAEESREKGHEALLESIEREAQPLEDGAFKTGYLSRMLRSACPRDTTWVIEAVNNSGLVHQNIRPTIPGSWINSGGGGLGWSGGAALGVKMALDATGKGGFVCQVVGDGTYMFSVPGTVYWIARRYKIPVLVIILNNDGWNAPRTSLELVHPDGIAAKATNQELNISFAPVPDYAGIAAAAGNGEINAIRVDRAFKLDNVLYDAVLKVKAGKTTVVDCRIVPEK